MVMDLQAHAKTYMLKRFRMRTMLCSCFPVLPVWTVSVQVVSRGSVKDYCTVQSEGASLYPWEFAKVIR